jgi:transposase
VVMIGIDAHKRTHTAVAIDEVGRELAIPTVAATSSGHLALLRWAAEIAEDRSWAVEDCRHLSRHLERDLLASGERILRVPPKMMANARDCARTYGKSDPIDALAIARAALREPDLPVAYLDGPARDLRLLVDHREALVAERTRRINRLRWHLHELQPGWDPPARTLGRARGLTELQAKLRCHSGTVVELASELVEDIAGLSERIAVLEGKIAAMVAPLAPALLAIVGCGALTAAKIIGEVGGASRFRSRDAFARHTAPRPSRAGPAREQARCAPHESATDSSTERSIPSPSLRRDGTQTHVASWNAAPTRTTRDDQQSALSSGDSPTSSTEPSSRTNPPPFGFRRSRLDIGARRRAAKVRTTSRSKSLPSALRRLRDQSSASILSGTTAVLLSGSSISGTS